MRRFRLRNYLSLLLVVLSLTTCLSEKAFSSKDFKVKETVLNNGLTIITSEIHTFPIVALDMWVKVGSADENKENNGVSHFIEHMLFKGTKERGVGEIDKAIEGRGGRLNAGTSYDFTHYYITVPSLYWEEALEILGDLIFNPAFDKEELERERRVILEEIGRGEDNPESYLRDLFYQTAYQKHPYRLPILGSRESVRSLKRDDLLNYYQKHYHPNNMALVVVGDFKTERVLSKVRELFKDFKAEELPLIASVKEPEQTEERKVVLSKDLKQSYLILGFPAPSVKEKKDVYAMDLIITILGEGRNSRLEQELKEKKNLVSSISADYLTQKDPGLFYILATLEPEKIDKVREEILSQIDNLKRREVGKKELEKAKRLLSSMVAFDTETNNGKSSYLGFYFAIDKISFALTYLDGIKKVTPSQIKEVANKYLRGNYTLCILQPSGIFKPGTTSK